MGRGGELGEVARLALRLGFTAFGGPAAHIAMLREEVVARRGWVTDQFFLDLLGATNLIPGPNSTEMVIHVGRERAGWKGLLAGGALFILPSACMVMGLAWAYVRYGSTPEATWLLYGVKPVIIAVVVQALWGLARTAVKGRLLGAVGLAVLALYLAGVNELLLMFGAGLLVAVVRNGGRVVRGAVLLAGAAPWALEGAACVEGHAGGRGDMLEGAGCFAHPGSVRVLGSLAGGVVSGSGFWLAPVAAAAPVQLSTLFLTFLKIGAVLYGSGYVLLAFLRADLVERLGWLTDQQLLDAVAIGQVTPGPVFTTATFVGYVAAGAPGAVLATLGIFLPSFLYVAAVGPLVSRLRRSVWMGALLDGVNVAAVGLMAAVALQLGRAALVDAPTVGLAAGAAVLLIRYRVSSTWLLLCGAAVGVASRLVWG